MTVSDLRGRRGQRGLIVVSCAQPHAFIETQTRADSHLSPRVLLSIVQRITPDRMLIDEERVAAEALRGSTAARVTT